MHVTPQMKDMKQWVGDNVAAIGVCGALVFAAVVLLWLTSGTSYQQLIVGLITSSITLLVVLLLFEAAWHLAMMVVKAAGEEQKDK